jgi:hypothetical protein
MEKNSCSCSHCANHNIFQKCSCNKSMLGDDVEWKNEAQHHRIEWEIEREEEI